MPKSSLKDAVELIGIAAIVASLVFVGLQIRQEQEIAIVDTYGELSQSNIELTFEIGEQMDLWKKGLGGENLTAEELDNFSVLTAAVTEYNQRVFIRWTRLGPIDPGVAASRFAFALYVFPGLRREWESSEQWGSHLDTARGNIQRLTAWESRVNGYLEQYDRENPPMPTNKRYIFWDY